MGNSTLCSPALVCYAIRTETPRVGGFMLKRAVICCRCEFSAISVIFRPSEWFKGAGSGGVCSPQSSSKSKFPSFKFNISRESKWWNLSLRQPGSVVLNCLHPVSYWRWGVFDCHTRRFWATKNSGWEKRVFFFSLLLRLRIVTLLPIWVQQAE